MTTSLRRKTLSTSQLPKAARDLLREHVVEKGAAFVFLGMEPSSKAGYAKSRRYRERVGKYLETHRFVDLDVSRPRRTTGGGGWAEIANYEVGGKLLYPTHHLVWMVYPEWEPGEDVEEGAA